MRIFRLPRPDKSRLDKESPRMRFFRHVLLALLFCAVIWGFWMNNERRLNAVKRGSAAFTVDATGLLGEKELEKLALYQERFHQVYGLNLVVAVRKKPIETPFLAPGERGGTVFIGLCPKARQALIELPPLVEAALGQSLAEHLRREHFLPYFNSGLWPEGLAEGLNILSTRLDAALLQGRGDDAARQRPLQSNPPAEEAEQPEAGQGLKAAPQLQAPPQSPIAD